MRYEEFLVLKNHNFSYWTSYRVLKKLSKWSILDIVRSEERANFLAMMHSNNFFMLQKLMAFKASSLNCLTSGVNTSTNDGFISLTPHLSGDELWTLLTKLENQKFIQRYILK